MSTDRNGKPITVGCRVRIVSLQASLTEALPADEQVRVSSMIDEILTVIEIDEAGRAWVERSFDQGSGLTSSHSVALTSNDMERID